MNTRLLVAVALGLSCEGKDDTAAGGDADADTDTDSDTDTDTDTDTFFLHVEGTFDGSPFELDCPPSLLTGLWLDPPGLVVGVCEEAGKGEDAGDSIGLFVLDPKEGDVTTCSETSSILVGTGKDYYDCFKGGVASYDMNITEVTPSAKSTIWSGTFAVAGDDGMHSTDVSGSFRIDSPVP